MKKLVLGLVLGLILGAFGTANAAGIKSYVAKVANYKIAVNGNEFKPKKPVVTINKDTYVSLTDFCAAANLKLVWNNKSKQYDIGESTPVIKDVYSMKNPAPLGASQTIEVSDFTNGNYVLAKINFKALIVPNDKAYSISNYSFTLISDKGKAYESEMLVCPDPSISANLYEGSENEGWAAFKVSKDDKKPKIVFGRKYDGSGGIWFKSY